MRLTVLLIFCDPFYYIMRIYSISKGGILSTMHLSDNILIDICENKNIFGENLRLTNKNLNKNRLNEKEKNIWLYPFVTLLVYQSHQIGYFWGKIEANRKIILNTKKHNEKKTAIVLEICCKIHF